ncbi:hypothetical protein Tco_0711488 [Tanacetum coccineum]
MYSNATKKDLSWMGLPEFVDDTITDYSRPTPSIKVSKDVSDEQKSIWKSNSDSSFEQGGSFGNVASKPMIRFVKETGYPSVSKVNNTENSRKPTVKYGRDGYRKHYKVLEPTANKIYGWIKGKPGRRKLIYDILTMLHCFSLASGLKINLQKSNLLGVGVTGSLVNEAAASIGCSVMKAPFKYLGVMVGGNMSKINAWDDMVGKIKSRLSKWKINTLSIRGRLTLLKAVLGSTPIYPMSLYKVPKTMLHEMESLRRNFFNGVQGVDRKISWVKWTKVLASKKYGGLGVSSFYALNRALLFRWVWRFLSHDNSLWFRCISAMHGSSFQIRSSFHCSN